MGSHDAVVENSGVGRPRPRPIGINVKARWIVSATTERVAARLRSDMRCRCNGHRPWCRQLGEPGEARQLLASFNALLGLGVGKFGPCFAVNLHAYSARLC